MRNSPDSGGFSGSSADPEEDWPDHEPGERIPVRPGAPHLPGKPKANEFANEEKHEEVGARFGGSDADAEPAAKNGCEGEDGGADPEEKQRRDFASDILGGEKIGQNGIAAKDDAIDDDVTENDRRNGSEQLHARASWIATSENFGGNAG